MSSWGDVVRGSLSGRQSDINGLVGRLLPQPPNPRHDLHGKQVIVSGSTQGIGYEIALELARMGCILVMAVRDVEKGRRVAAQIERKTGNQTVEVLGVDFGSLASVKQALDKWHARSPRGRTIDVLINNAGLLTDRKTTSEDGLEMTYQTNFLAGTFYWTLHLLDCVSPTGRILMTSSAATYYGRAPVVGNGSSPDILDKYSEGDGLPGGTLFALYARSKASQTIFAQELQRRLLRSPDLQNVFVAASHPGIVRTAIWKRTSPAMSQWQKDFVPPFIDVIGIPASDGALTNIWLASDPDVAKPAENKGAFFDRRYRRWPPGWVMDAKLRDDLWKQWLDDAQMKSDPTGVWKM